MSIKADSKVVFRSGHQMKNRLMLSPLTNTQSHDDGTLSDEEMHWLVMRAQGGFGMVMTCAAHVQKRGQGFPGQLGIYDDYHIPGHQKLTKAIKSYGCLSVTQLHHAGMRSPQELINEAPQCPTSHDKYGARALNTEEVKVLRDDFIRAAARAQESGYDGVEIHGAHGYIIAQFLSSQINRRTDSYGGSLENRSRLLFEIIEGIRHTCGKAFLLGVRLSPERFGMKLSEMLKITQKIADDGIVDFLDLSLWDCFKLPEEEAYKDKSLLMHVSSINYADTKLTVAGNIRSGADVSAVLNAGADFATIGRAAILHHDFAQQVINDPDFSTINTPVTEAYLNEQGLSPKFIQYMYNWPNFVKQE